MLVPEYEHPPERTNRRLQKLDHCRMLTELTQVEARNVAIVDRLAECVATGRQILALSDRRQHLTDIEALLRAKSPPTLTAGLFVGGMKPAERASVVQRQVLLATYPMAAEALDVPSLSIVVLLTPKPNVVQSVARVMRGRGAAHAPLIVDVLDQYSMWHNFWFRRCAFYRQEGFLIVRPPSVNTDSDDDDRHACTHDAEEPPPSCAVAGPIRRNVAASAVASGTVKKPLRRCPF